MTPQSFVRRLLATPAPVGAVAVAYSVAFVAFPTALRALVDPVVQGTTYATYYPFVLLAAVLLSWRVATTVTLASAVVGDFLFVEPRLTFFPNPGERFGAALFLISAALIIAVGHTLRRTVEELSEARNREEYLNGELQHRVKNTLAVVQGLVSQTFRGLPDVKPALEKLHGRLRALADANDTLRDGKWDGCCLPDLAVRSLAAFNEGGAISLIGPPCCLPELSCVPLMLALHELATNALKYGSLSDDQGTVALSWQVCAGLGSLEMCWEETGGPKVVPPTRQGLGSRLLRPQRGLESVALDFRPDGLTAVIEISGVRPINSEALQRSSIAPAAMDSLTAA